jgi:CrcB protein
VLAVNAGGCFLIGLAAGLAEHTRWITPEVRWTVVTGFLGGLTTFSALGADTFFLGKSGHPGVAGASVAANLILGVVLVAAGYQAAGWARS